MLKIKFSETQKSIGIKCRKKTRYYKVGSRVVPYRGISFLNVICVLRKALGVTVSFKIDVGEISGRICTLYQAEIEGEVFFYKSLGNWKQQEESAIKALEMFVNRLICYGHIELPEAQVEGVDLSKRTPHGELVEMAC